MESLQQDQAGPSRGDTSTKLDPLPSSHPLSLKLRSVFDHTSSLSPDSLKAEQALEDLEIKYRVVPVKKNEQSASRNGRLSRFDTDKARKFAATDAQDTLEEACSQYLSVLQDVDEVSPDSF